MLTGQEYAIGWCDDAFKGLGTSDYKKALRIYDVFVETLITDEQYALFGRVEDSLAAFVTPQWTCNLAPDRICDLHMQEFLALADTFSAGE